MFPPTPINLVIEQDFAFINITSNEALSNAVLGWNGTNETMLGSAINWYKNKTSLENGNYSYIVFGTDLAGNENKTDEKWVYVNVTFLEPAVYIGEEEPIQADADNDEVGNACDNCWYVPNPDQNDTNSNCPLPPYETDPQCGDACEVAALTLTIELPKNCTDPDTCEGYYHKGYVPLNFTVEPDPDWIGYSLNSGDNVTITGNTTMDKANLTDGSLNDVTVFANDTQGNMGSSDLVYFFYCFGDINKDRTVNMKDIYFDIRLFASKCGDGTYEAKGDINDDCVINMKDIYALIRVFNKKC